MEQEERDLSLLCVLCPSTKTEWNHLHLPTRVNPTPYPRPTPIHPLPFHLLPPESGTVPRRDGTPAHPTDRLGPVRGVTLPSGVTISVRVRPGVVSVCHGPSSCTLVCPISGLKVLVL